MAASSAQLRAWTVPESTPRTRSGGWRRGRAVLVLFAALDLGIYALVWHVGTPPTRASVSEIRRDRSRPFRPSRSLLTELNYSRRSLPPECRRALEPGYGLIDPCA